MKRKSQSNNNKSKSKRSKSQLNENTEKSIKNKDYNSEDEYDDEGRAGRVRRIYLKNFMCHTLLEVDFNTNVNYIIGRNGSGKSAILAALIVGLGGKANITNRGSSMTSLIKRGQNSTVVEITLTNTGPMAYKKNSYGKKIIVQRIISLTGGSRYKLKDESGNVISSAFKDVRRLIEALNIQVDNPVSILNQDVARTFLNTNDTRKKYKMFMKATNLENIQDQFKLAVQLFQETRITLQGKNDSLDALERESKKLHKKVKMIDSVNEIKNKKQNLEMELIWCKAYDAETEMIEEEQEVKKMQTEITKLQSQTKTEQKKGLQTQISSVEQQLKEIQEKEKSNQQIINTVKTDLRKVNEAKFTKEKEIDAINERIKTKKVDQKDIEDELERAESSQPNKQQILLEKTKKNEELQNKLHAINDQIATTENEITQSRQALQLKRNDEKNIGEEMQHVDGKIVQRKAQMRSLKSQEYNSMAVYGRNMHLVIEYISGTKEQFSELPRGPIGSYIKLKDKQWALAVEEYLGFSMLQSFCVNNSNDSDILNKIFQKVFGNERKPTIICSKFFHKIHNTSRFKTFAPSDCVALLDVLQITDPVITNCLIDQLHIETIMLTPTTEMSMKLMSDARNVPKNCTRSITIKGDQFYPDPNYRSYAGRQKTAKFLQINITELVQEYETDFRKLTETSKNIIEQGQAIKMDIHNLQITLRNLEEKLIGLNSTKLKIQNLIQDFHLEEVPTERNLDILRDELADIKKYIKNKSDQIGTIKEKINTIKLGAKDMQIKIDNLKKISNDLNKRSVPLIQQLDDANIKLKAIDIDVKYKTERLKKIQAKLSEQIVIYNDKKLNYERCKNWAEEISGEPAVKKTLQEVTTELEEINKTLTEINVVVGDRDIILPSYKKVEAKVKEIKVKVNKMTTALLRMKESIDIRKREYKRLKYGLTQTLKDIFTNVLNIRKFNGTLEIDHESQSLELIVIPQHGTQNKKHILSGGERSYATVSFLLTLWQVMEFPFYYLDEFDVFMDKVNRRAVMDMLLRHGLDHKYLQYVFLTPQDVSSVECGENVTIHRMEDPERNDPK